MSSSAPRIKVCGVTSLPDAVMAADHGAWAVGCILWPHSPRACDPAEAARIVGALRRRVEVAGVFVNAPLDEVAGMVDGVGFSLVQLHGDEGPAYCAEVARRTGAKVIKAAPIRLRSDIVAMEAFHCDFHLLDAHQPGRRGGTGTTFDWQLVAERRTRIPLILSGGLTAENVGEAIAATHPFAVDVASGTEAAPGVKDPERLSAFFDGVRATAPADAHEGVAS
ncbi:MAG: phosphoribosylanthranilate isomerase [Solirubrobacteraceae bacterium]